MGNVFPAFCIGSSDFKCPNLYEGDVDVLNKYSYNEIKDICQKNEAEKSFKVGDKLLISLGELTLEKETIPQQTALAKISNISANGNWIEMNIIGYSKKAPIMRINGGSCSSWKSTTLREWLNEKFLNALPKELKDILVTRYHTSQSDICDEKVWLPREMEVFDNKMQTDYFKTNKLRYSGNSICSWWLQTLASSSAKYGHTYHTDSKNSQFFASAINQKVEEFACRPLGVFPSFCIGKKSDRYKKDATSQINTINGYTFKEIQEFCDNDEVWKHFQPGDSGFIKLKPITGLTVRGRCLEYENTPSQVAEVTILRTDFNNMDLMITNYEFKAPRYYMDGYRHNKTYDNAILEGWGGSNMREWLNKNFIEALPPELVSLLYSRNNTYATFHLQYSYNIHSRESEPFFWHYGKPSDVTGTSDKVWLLSEGDISDKNNKSYASWENQYAYDRQDQLPFFKEGGTTKMYENNKAVEYWLRNLAETSDNPEFGSKSSYGIVTESGNLYYNRADVLKAVFPCFSIKHYHSYPSYKYNSSFSCPF